jgi:hypothetical protein
VHRSRSLFLSLGVSLVFAASLQAIVYIVPSDRDLVRRADAIVIATAIESHAELTSRGAVVTASQLHVEDVLKGSPLSGSEIRIVEPGGIMSERATIIYGSPAFGMGKRYLVFLTITPDGEWATYGFQIGQFQFTTDLRGHELLTRAGDESIFGLNETDGSLFVDRFRSAPEFLDFIRATGDRSGPARGDYFVEKSDVVLATFPEFRPRPTFVIVSNYTRPSYLSFSNSRWQNAGRSFGYCCPGGYPTMIGSNMVNAPSAATSAVTAWNGSGTSIQYTMSGETPGRTAGINPDGANTVLFNDPGNQVPAGIFAIGGPTNSDGTYTLPDGFTYNDTIEGDVVVEKNSAIPPYVNQTLLIALLTHEVGHTLGFRHSDGTASTTSPPPNCNASTDDCANPGSAVMASTTPSNFIGGLRQWDHNAAQTVYGSGPTCTNPSITTQPQSQSIAFGASATLSVTAGGSSPFTYQWYIGSSGDTSNSIPGATNPTVTVSPTVTTNYWVRVSNSCTPPAPVDSNTAIVTVQACQPPNIITQPQDQTVPSGSSAQLTVGFNGTAPITVTWYRGTSGDTSQGSIGSGATVNTPPITTTSMFWARLQNSCGTADTRTVTVNAGACTPPTINTQPQDQTVSPGGTVVLNVGFSGSGATVSWFQGNSGDTSGGVVATGPTTISPPINASTSFWARVTGCGQSVNSRTAIIMVSAGCVPPSIATSPANQTIGRGGTVTLTVVAGGTAPLHYAWFQGASGDESTPVGTDADTFTSASLTAATQFWVKVTNTCGAANSTAANITVAVGRKHAVKRR